MRGMGHEAGPVPRLGASVVADREGELSELPPDPCEGLARGLHTGGGHLESREEPLLRRLDVAMQVVEPGQSRQRAKVIRPQLLHLFVSDRGFGIVAQLGECVPERSVELRLLGQGDQRLAQVPRVGEAVGGRPGRGEQREGSHVLRSRDEGE